MAENDSTRQEPSGDQDSRRNKNKPQADDVKVDIRRALVGGGLSAVVMLTGAWLVGEATGMESLLLLEISLSSMRSFCGTVTLALGNILALMLTLLSLSASTDVDLSWAFYRRVNHIAWVVTVVLICSILVYLLLNVPLAESESRSDSVATWYTSLYYTILVLSSLLGGALIFIVLMLYNTIKNIIQILGHRGPSQFIRSENE